MIPRTLFENDTIEKLLKELVKKLDEKGQLMPGSNKDEIVKNVMETLKQGDGYKFSITPHDNASMIKGLSNMLVGESINQKFPGLKLNIPKLLKDLPKMDDAQKAELQKELKTLFKIAIETKLTLKLGRNLNQEEKKEVDKIADNLANSIVYNSKPDEMLRENNDAMKLLIMLTLTLKDLAQNNPKELTERSVNAGMDIQGGGIQSLVTEIGDLSLDRTLQSQGLNEAMSVLEGLKRFDLDRPGALEAVAFNDSVAIGGLAAEIVENFEASENRSLLATNSPQPKPQ